MAVKRIEGYHFMAPVVHQLDYLVHYERKLENLKRQLNKLDQVTESLRAMSGTGSQNRQVDVVDLQRRLERAQEIKQEVQKFLEDKANIISMKRGTVKGFLSRLQLGKELYEMTANVDGVLDECQSYALLKPAPLDPWIKLASDTVMIMPNTFPFQEVIEALRDENVRCIGIYGMVGVGKTTFVKQVAKRAKDEELSNEVVMAVVSRAANMLRIQNGIADMLDLRFREKTVWQRRPTLCERLKSSERVLVILDDVWEPLDLVGIGIPTAEEHRGLKLIITTRFRRVCTWMTQKEFQIHTMSEQDSWDLFKKVAGDSVDSPDLEPVAREVAARCGGLPRAIVSIGSKLENQSKRAWEDALYQLNKPNNDIFPKDLFDSLKLSYKQLESKEIKFFFLLCSLFPEDRDIAIEDLFRHGIGLEMFEEAGSLNEGRREAESLVNTLKDSCWLVDSNEKGCVKMNSVVRHFGLTIASRDNYFFVVRADTNKREKLPLVFPPPDCRAISVPLDDVRLPDNFDCPNLQILVMNKNDCQLDVSELFFSYMNNLQVLVLSGMRNLLLPKSFELLVNLRTLYLNHCKLASTSELQKLRKLEILSLSDSCVTDLPLEIRHLTRLKLLDLTNCEYRVPVLGDALTNCEYLIAVLGGILSSLHHLEELYVGVLHVRDYQSLRDLLSSYPAVRLTVLVLEICDAQDMEEIVAKSDGEDHKITLSWPETLVLQRLPSLTSFGWRNYSVEWPLLKKVRVDNCPKISIISLGDMLEEDDLPSIGPHLFNSKVVFPHLEELHLTHLDNLLDIWRGSSPSSSFNELKVLKLESCAKLLNAIPFHMLKILCNLECIVARNCDSLTEIFSLEGIFTGDHAPVLPQLKIMVLTNLPELVHFWKSPTQIVVCGNLRDLTVTNCKTLRSLFLPAMVGSLLQLETLSVDGCEALEEIIEIEEAEIVIEQYAVLLPQLKKMTLVNLPNLVHIWRSPTQSIHRVVFPRLKELHLLHLDNLTTICGGLLPPTSFTELRFLELDNCGKFLNAVPFHMIEKLHNLECIISRNCGSLIEVLNLEVIVTEPDAGLLPGLRKMTLTNLSELVHIWKSPTHVIVCRNLRNLTVSHCKNLRILFSPAMVRSLLRLETLLIYGCEALEEIVEVKAGGSVQPVESFQSLKELQVFSCNSLRSLCSLSVARFLMNLQVLNVDGCQKIEEILMDDKGDKGPSNKIMFPRLNCIILKELPNLASFYPGNYTFEFPSLETVKMSHCPNMETFSSKPQITPKLKAVEVSFTPNLLEFSLNKE